MTQRKTKSAQRIRKKKLSKKLFYYFQKIGAITTQEFITSLKIKIKRNRLRFFGKRNRVINETAKITVSCPLHTHKKPCVQYSYCFISSAILLHCLRQLKCNRRKCNQWICHLQKVKHQPINQKLICCKQGKKYETFY